MGSFSSRLSADAGMGVSRARRVSDCCSCGDADSDGGDSDCSLCSDNKP